MGLKYFLLCVFAYLIGSMNPAIIITYLFKRRDIRELYDGNPGATNVYINVGKTYGVMVGVLDLIKGFTPILIAHTLGIRNIPLAIVGALVILGHDFPVFYNFKGGTGISSTIGGLLFFEPRFTIVLVIISIALIVYLSNRNIENIIDFTPLEFIEASGFVLAILYLFLFADNYTGKAYILFVITIVVSRQIPRVKRLFAKNLLK